MQSTPRRCSPSATLRVTLSSRWNRRLWGFEVATDVLLFLHFQCRRTVFPNRGPDGFRIFEKKGERAMHLRERQVREMPGRNFFGRLSKPFMQDGDLLNTNSGPGNVRPRMPRPIRPNLDVLSRRSSGGVSHVQ